MIKSAKELTAEEKMRLICGKDFGIRMILGGNFRRSPWRTDRSDCAW